jgi:dihydrofolate reductase
MIVSMLVAADEKNGIGFQNKLPWHLPADLKYFKKLTLDHHVLMGRKTYESIGKPLVERVNLVLTSDERYTAPGVVTINSLREGINVAKEANESELFVIGGATVFRESMPLSNLLYLTRIHERFPADTFLPFEISPDWKLVSSESHPADEKNKWPYTFEVYELTPSVSPAAP